jgi:hypothetical protein
MEGDGLHVRKRGGTVCIIVDKAVKLADIDHNSDHTRLEPNDPRIPYWREKYAAARKILCE